MNFNKILIICLLLSFVSFANSYADDHESKEQDIIEKAKEINQKVKLQQAEKEENIRSELEVQKNHYL